jgi:hypothetical protein
MVAPAMMSSVIPARLEFQCGHAALVSLPRVRGESPAQRTDRIGREKSAAKARSCDFCPPRVEVVQAAQPVVPVEVQVQAAPPPPPVVVLRVPPVELPVPPVPTSTDGATTTSHKRASRLRRRPAPSAPSAQNGRAVSYRFVVRFRTEAVLEATNIRDALRQAESLGATEVLALSRNV